MSVEIVSGATTKPVVTEHLAKFFENNAELDGELFLGFPVMPTPGGTFTADAVWISRNKGLVIFNLLESDDGADYKADQDNAYNKFEAKLRQNDNLMKGRKLCADIHVITFASAAVHNQMKAEQKDADVAINSDTNTNTESELDFYPLCFTAEDLQDSIKKIPDTVYGAYYEILLSVIQGLKGIGQQFSKRSAVKLESRGSRLNELEKSIATLDAEQQKAAIETIDGVQRIRGLAGSGKSVVLAYKIAYLHSVHPDWRIAVTFYTRTLKEFFKRLVTQFFYQFEQREPDWQHIEILNSWGGEFNRDGLYSRFCALTQTKYYSFNEAQIHDKKDPFGFVCMTALDTRKESSSEYFDVILVDEAQDFSPHFLRLCYALLKEPKRLVYAYDEMQNLGSCVLPEPEEIFGVNDSGIANVSFKSQERSRYKPDLVLRKCYRNTRKALVTAHALAFGIYRDKSLSNHGLVQMFDNPRTWFDVGYENDKTELIDYEKEVSLYRPEANSLIYLENLYCEDDLITFKRFVSKVEQDRWVLSEIKRNLNEDDLGCNDILVIDPDPLQLRNNIADIMAGLNEMGIKAHIPGVGSTPDKLFAEHNDSVTLTSVYRAKGNEAAMVYIINADSCYGSSYNLVTVRNRLFTAITRSKAWVRVIGTGERMEALMKEYQELKNHKFKLDFTYPSREELKSLHTLRGMDLERNEKDNEYIRLTKARELVLSGKRRLEDFDPKIQQVLKSLAELNAI